MVKTFVIFVLISFFAGAVQAGLLDRWKLENPGVNFVSETNTFTLTYDVNEDITKDNVRAKIFTAKCQDPEDGSKGIEVLDGVTVKSTDVVDSKGTFEFTLDIKELSNNNDVLDISNPQKPSINLCARYMLWTGGTYEVNFLETILHLDFDLTDVGLSFSSLVSKNFDSSSTEIA